MVKVRKSGSRNPQLAEGVNVFGRSAMAAKTWRFHFAKRHTAAAAKAPVAKKPARFFEADRVPTPLRRHTPKATAVKLRKSITPGTVLIVLSGRFRGKRVVFLRQLESSGLLLVTGPYKVNGVPLRRLNQAYVIATKTKVDVSGIDTSAINDDFFKRVESSESKAEGAEGAFFAQAPKAVQISAERKNAQKAVDAKLLAALGKDKAMKQYLGAKFSLTNGQAPHEMTF